MRQSELSKLTLAGLMLALVCNRLANVLADDSLVWRLHDVTISANFAFAAMLALQHIPYRLLRAKCLAAGIAGAAIADSVYVAVNLSGYWYWLIAQCLVGGGLIVIYLVRSYTAPSDQLANDGRVYCLRTYPSSLQDFLIALTGLYGPRGGYALYADGILYRYRRGVLVAQSVDRVPLDRYHVTRGGMVTEQFKADISRVIGSRWSWRHNCLTVLGPIWSRSSG